MAAEKILLSSFMQHTGISFRNMGSFLELSPSLLNMHLGSTRSLPAQATLQLALAQQIIVANGQLAAKAAPGPQIMGDGDRAFVKQEAQWCMARCRPLQKKLDSMQQKYRQGAATIPLLNMLEKLPENQTPKKQRWIAEQRYQAEKKMKINNWLAKKKLEMAINLLQHEAALWEAV